MLAIGVGKKCRGIVSNAKVVVTEDYPHVKISDIDLISGIGLFCYGASEVTFFFTSGKQSWPEVISSLLLTQRDVQLPLAKSLDED